MVNLRVEDKVYNMPSNWEEVTIKTYQELQKVMEQEYPNLKQIVYFISVLSKCPIDLLYKCNIEDLNKIDLSWISTKIDNKIEKITTINDKKYGVIKDMKHLSLGEYIDLDEFSKNINDNMHKVCAILMRPVIQEDGDLYIIEKYDTNSLEQRAKLFLDNMNVIQLYSLSSFFLTSASIFLKNLNPSLQAVEKVQKKKSRVKKI